MHRNNITGQEGQVFILALVVVGLVLMNTLIIISNSLTFFQNSHYLLEASQANALAEAGVDKAVASLNISGGSYTGESETVLGEGSFSVTVYSPDTSSKFIESTGYIPSKAVSKVKRTVRITASKGVGTAFNYAVQVGSGGLEMSPGSEIRGSVYSNGNIVMDNNSKITGEAYVAGGVAVSADQEAACEPVNCTDYLFGRTVNGEERLDIAQSFKLTSGGYLSRVSLRLKKVGSPADITVRILQDLSGTPDKDQVLSSGTLAASLATTNYGLVNIALSPAAYLNPDTPYWVVLDTSSSTNNYWFSSADSLKSYTRGEAFWSDNWRSNGPSWSAINLDLDFKAYTGGQPTFIQGSPGVSIEKDAHANTLQDLNILGGAYYQTIQNTNAAAFYPNSPDPTETVFPVSSANILQWQQQAANSQISSGDITSCPATLGPGKYTGNINLSNNCVVKVISPVWITGTLSLSNGATLNLDPLAGFSSGVIMVDGKVVLSNNVKIRGSGSPGSYLMILSNFDSRENEESAVEILNTGNEGIIYAGQGLVTVANNNRLTEVTAWKLGLGNNVIVEYDSGLSGTFFSSPGGAYSLVLGTYQIK